MQYRIDATQLSNAFMLPTRVADEHIKLVGAVQLKVLVWIFRNIAAQPDSKSMADALGVPEADINDALRYWCDAGILQEVEEDKKEITVQPPTKKAILSQAQKPDRTEVARRGSENPEIAFLLQEAQQIFGRGLRQSEISTLVWLYDEQGIGVAVLLMLIQYAASEERCNIGFIERTAIDWVNSGVVDLKSAEAKLSELALHKTAWSAVCRAFSIERRAPSKREQANAYKWVKEWGFSNEMLKAAYDACVDSISKLSLPYIDKILTAWHKQGVKTVADIEKQEDTQKKTNYDTYDLSLAEKMLKGDI